MGKIIAIDARISGTSTGRYVDKLIEYLHKESLKEKIVLLAKPERIEFLKQIAPSFEIIETSVPDFSFAEQTTLKKQIESTHADLVHFPMVQQPILYKGKVVTSMLDLTTLKFTNPSKNLIIFKTKQLVYRFVNRKAAKKSTHIITISNYVRDNLIEMFGIEQSKITTTYNAADRIADKPEALNNLKEEKFIMYVGRPLPHKNLERLMEAFVEIRKTHPDLKLVLAGKKDVLFERHEERARELGIADSVVFTGFVNEGQLRWLYEKCQAYVFPSLSEGFGLPGLEAMMHGAPVVSSNATCLPEIYEDAAHYFDPLNIDDMAIKICEVLDDKKLREELINKGHAQAAKFSWKRMAEQTLEVYRTALSNS